MATMRSWRSEALTCSDNCRKLMATSLLTPVRADARLFVSSAGDPLAERTLMDIANGGS
jgi:hypothetical protein